MACRERPDTLVSRGKIWPQDTFSILVMSSEPEGVLCGAKNAISEQRNSRKTDTIELLLYLQRFYRMRIFIKQDLHTVVASQAATPKIESEAIQDYAISANQ